MAEPGKKTTRQTTNAVASSQSPAVPSSLAPRKSFVADFIEALLDPQCQQALNQCLNDNLVRIVGEAVDRRLAPMEAAIDALRVANTRIEATCRDLSATVAAISADNLKLVAQAQVTEAKVAVQAKDHESRVEELELYSRSHDLMIRGLP